MLMRLASAGVIVLCSTLEWCQTHQLTDRKWCRSHKATTTNLAEYFGLLHGLRGAQSNWFTPLLVVGDSDMIIRQNQQHHPPKNRKLRQLYLKARRIADVMGVLSWHHHYRQYNKMADRAANMAMDTASSFQALAATRPLLTVDLVGLQSGDVQY